MSNKKTGLILASLLTGWLGCSDKSGITKNSSSPLLDTTLVVPGQRISFASMKLTILWNDMGPQFFSVPGDTVFMDTYVSALQCTVTVFSELYHTRPKNGYLFSQTLAGMLRFSSDIVDSIGIATQSGADSGWNFRVVPKAGTGTFAGRSILAAKGNRGYLVSIGVAADSLATWKDRIDSIAKGIRFLD